MATDFRLVARFLPLFAVFHFYAFIFFFLIRCINIIFFAYCELNDRQLKSAFDFNKPALRSLPMLYQPFQHGAKAVEKLIDQINQKLFSSSREHGSPGHPGSWSKENSTLVRTPYEASHNYENLKRVSWQLEKRRAVTPMSHVHCFLIFRKKTSRNSERILKRNSNLPRKRFENWTSLLLSRGRERNILK